MITGADNVSYGVRSYLGDVMNVDAQNITQIQMHSVAYSPCTISRFQGITPLISSTGAGYVAISFVVT